eukprot:TRINITY_DN2103_c0_g1_i7.p1 TRINITY_DN2103_c0_g1~~TRINITY_DN2103_c0_g1_i7.p1  ORF type:complete len:176 (-),score=27.84 TRINITY_DN2103_c0_g1_i7:368-895(-)
MAPCWGDNLPANFSWMKVNRLAGSARPTSELELRSLVGVGIRDLVTLSPDAKPPPCVVRIPSLRWTVIPVQNFHGATPEQFQTFFDICDKAGIDKDLEEERVSDGGGPSGVLVHCYGGNGRTGMFLAAFLMKYNQMSAADAIQAVRSVRPRSVETRKQEQALAELETWLLKHTAP